MSTAYPDVFAALAAEFEDREVKTVTKGSRPVRYVTARTVMNRLDEAVGPENWRDSYAECREGLRCTLEVRVGGEWVAKADGGAGAGMSDEDDDEKSAYSSAFKRAAVKWGVGRYLYRDGVPRYGARPAPRIEIDRPEAPPLDARQAGDDPAPARPREGPGPNRVNGRPHDGPPRTGKALFAWTKDREQEYEVGLLKYLNQWSKLQEFPDRMVDWDAEQVALAHAEALRKLAAVGEGQGRRFERAVASAAGARP